MALCIEEIPMKLVELLNFRAPEGFHSTVSAEARKRGITFAELIRRAVAKDIASAPWARTLTDGYGKDRAHG